MSQAAKVIPFVLEAGKHAVQTTKAVKKYEKEEFGYDFISLGQKLLIFFAIAYIIKLYFDIVNGAASFWLNVLAFFRLNVPTNAPNQIVNFMKNGYHGITYWQIIKIVSIALVGFEMYRYYESNKPNANVVTMSIFGLFIGFLVMISWDIFKSFTESGFLTSGGGSFSSSNGSSEGIINQNLNPFKQISTEQCNKPDGKV